LTARWLGLSFDAGANAAASTGFLARTISLLVNQNANGISFMIANGLRFVAWQNLALIPFVALAIPLARRGDPIAGPLYAGLLLTTVAMMVLLPYQGHGWGYRYFHGLLGSVAILGAYGWRHANDRRMADTLLVVGSAVTIGLTTPFLLRQAYDFIQPNAVMDAKISHMNVDFVVLDDRNSYFVQDLVRNNPFLINRPLRFSGRHLTAPMLDNLCRSGSVGFVRADSLPTVLLLGSPDAAEAPELVCPH
jgi:hypothetical protein